MNDQIEELDPHKCEACKGRRLVWREIWLDDNNINEKIIIGFMSFFMMILFGLVDLGSGLMGNSLTISDTIYSSFVILTLGCFGISEAGKIFGK